MNPALFAHLASIDATEETHRVKERIISAIALPSQKKLDSDNEKSPEEQVCEMLRSIAYQAKHGADGMRGLAKGAIGPLTSFELGLKVARLQQLLQETGIEISLYQGGHDSSGVCFELKLPNVLIPKLITVE